MTEEEFHESHGRLIEAGWCQIMDAYERAFPDFVVVRLHQAFFMGARRVLTVMDELSEGAREAGGRLTSPTNIAIGISMLAALRDELRQFEAEISADVVRGLRE